MLSSGFHSYPNMLSHREGQNKHVDGNTHKQRYLFFVTASPFGPVTLSVSINAVTTVTLQINLGWQPIFGVTRLVY